MSEATDQYRELRHRTDGGSRRLVVLHDAHLACRPGCHDCCTELSVSAVEYAAIFEDLRAAGVTADALPSAELGAACSFLTGGLCGIYRFRPLICRTHGLPVAFRDGDEGEDDDGGSPPGMSVSFCPKNFTAADPADLEFGPDNTLELDALNAELAEVNVRFLREQSAGRPDGSSGPAPARVPLKRLREDLHRVAELTNSARSADG